MGCVAAKKHLHACWSIQALVQCATKQQVDLNSVDSYDAFFDYVTGSCEAESTTYISWKCTPDANKTCGHISDNWNSLKEKILEQDDGKTTVKSQDFDKIEQTLKNRKVVKHLKVVCIDADMKFIISFIEKTMPEIIHHCNQLKHFRTSMGKFQNIFNTVMIDIDFSENLSIPVKYGSQSLHWGHDQITIHSGILQVDGEKSYHPYLSKDHKHDQQFVQIILEEMLLEVEYITVETTIAIESDNCSSQYKSAAHLQGIQDLSNKYKSTIIRVYSIAEHGKGKADHVGRIVKTAIQREIAGGEVLLDCNHMVNYLKSKFSNNENPHYIIKEIKEGDLQIKRDNAKCKIYKRVDGSAKFQVIVFKPYSNSFKAANRPCVCDEYCISYGSCSLFQEYYLKVDDLKEFCLRSRQEEPLTTAGEDEDSFLYLRSICAMAADVKSVDTAWY